jgi:hypothetical protein
MKIIFIASNKCKAHMIRVVVRVAIIVVTAVVIVAAAAAQTASVRAIANADYGG